MRMQRSRRDQIMVEILKGKVQTVLGRVDPGSLGVTLTHEQLLLDLRCKPHYGPSDDSLTNLDFRLENIGKIKQFPYSVKNNLLVESADEVISELKLFKKSGGGTVCDVSPSEVRLKPELLPKLSRDSGLHIVAGTANYIDPLQSEETRQMVVREKADRMVQEIVRGIGETGVRCGFIGEVGCSWPLAASEKRSLQAAALAQQETGAPLMIHPGANPAAPFEILDILVASGADVSRVVMAHLDSTFQDRGKLVELARRGCVLEFDFFGTETSHYQLFQQLDMPSDAQRIQMVKHLVDAGYSHQVLISQDIHTKHKMVRYGGHGYAHIMEHIVPKMVERGIQRETVMDILTENPRNWLTFV